MVKLEWQCTRAFPTLVAPLVDAFAQLRWQSEHLGRLKAIITAEFTNEDLCEKSGWPAQRISICLDIPFLTTWPCEPLVRWTNLDNSAQIKRATIYGTCVSSDGHLWHEFYKHLRRTSLSKWATNASASFYGCRVAIAVYQLLVAIK